MSGCHDISDDIIVGFLLALSFVCRRWRCKSFKVFFVGCVTSAVASRLVVEMHPVVSDVDVSIIDETFPADSIGIAIIPDYLWALLFLDERTEDWILVDHGVAVMTITAGTRFAVDITECGI